MLSRGPSQLCLVDCLLAGQGGTPELYSPRLARSRQVRRPMLSSPEWRERGAPIARPSLKGHSWAGRQCYKHFYDGSRPSPPSTIGWGGCKSSVAEGGLPPSFCYATLIGTFPTKSLPLSPNHVDPCISHVQRRTITPANHLPYSILLRP